MSDGNWLSEFPADWEELRADFLCNPYRATVSPDRFEGEMVAHYSIPQVQATGGPLIEPADDIDSAKLLIRAPTLLVSKLNPRKKTICIAEPQDEMPTLASGEFIPIQSDQFDQRYAYYLWGSEKVTDRLSAIVQSATRSHQRVLPADILKLPWKWPPLQIQQRIAAFLDEKTARIDALIGKKQALLGRLVEKRQAIITQAVTYGLDPAAHMKDTGIDWLGQIPAHWEIKRLKYVSPRVTVGIVVTPAAYYADEGTLALRGLNIKTMDFDLSDTRNITDDGHELNRKSTLREGDLVSVRTGAPGTTAVVSQDLAGCNCIDLVIIRRPTNADARYIGWFLNSDIAKTQYQMGSEGALQQHFNVETSKEVVLSLPPAHEQCEISAYIDAAMIAHDRQRGMVEESVAKLSEYRSALITSAVTGQIEGLQ
ncbi:restriction endonuclease subunit S [Aurantiacibacter marinus]|uniref:restriction endonuclease subunit S n=1 Tax=Aurantiacibacter marinus TaxID=874156 RepID=UPI00069B9571|nr:restriction endonuclease subunit S [Aurantiacibacter marinus]